MASRSNKLSKLKAYRHGEDHDEIYEDGHDFEGFDVDSDFHFEGFPCNEGGNPFKEYKEKFINMLQNLKEQHLELNNEADLIPRNPIPKPLEDEEVEDIGYFVLEKGSRNGKDMITDSRGYNYSYWRETGSKNKSKHFRCIKRHSKGKSDCPSILRVINYKEENMKVSTTNEHNHEPDFPRNLHAPTKKPKTFEELLEKNSKSPHMEYHDHYLTNFMSSINITLL